MNSKVKVFIVGIVLIAASAGGVYYVINLTQQSAERAVSSGIDAEKNGETSKALEAYKKARDLCAPRDDECRVDMDMKVKLMTEAQNVEERSKAGEPAENVTIGSDEKAPDDTQINQTENNQP